MQGTANRESVQGRKRQIMAWMKWLKRPESTDLPKHCGLCLNFRESEHQDIRGVYWEGYCAAGPDPLAPTCKDFICCLSPSKFERA